MRCTWCGEETPDGSRFCESCGKSLAGPELAASASEGLAVDEGQAAADEATEDFPLFDDAYGEEVFLPIDVDPLREAQAYEADVPAVAGSFDDAPTVDAPSGPPEIKLRPSYIAVVAVIATLFSAAVILLAFALTIRFLGL